MHNQELSLCKAPLKFILNQMKGLKKPQKDFIIHVFNLFLSLKGKINFHQLSRLSHRGEQYFRNGFERKFDFMELNTLLLSEYKTRETVIAVDPSYISKSGKHTAGVDYFWSGCAGSVKWGLEIGGLALVDLKMNTAFHLEAFQTIRKKGEGLLDFYADGIVGRVDHILEFSQHIVADAYFSKRLFVDKLFDKKLHITSRLRRDAALRYLYAGDKRKGPGRPKEFDGPIDYANIDKSKMDIIEDNDLTRIYSAKVNSKALKKTIRVVIIYRFDKNKWTHKSYFSTNVNLSAQQIIDQYKSRFQIEFLYRDSKQHSGLNDCQARSENKLNFHLNMALSTINIAKKIFWLDNSKKQQKPFSMATVKTLCHNQYWIDLFISTFGISPNTKINKKRIKNLREIGTIAA